MCAAPVFLQMHRMVDRKRAIISRLLQRRCVAVCRRLPDEEAIIARTKGSKPYDATPRTADDAAVAATVDQLPGVMPTQQERDSVVAVRAADVPAPNFNFNVSHEGYYVVLASESTLLVGIDVSAPFALRDAGPPLGDYEKVRETFSNVLSDNEWELVDAAPEQVARAANAAAKRWAAQVVKNCKSRPGFVSRL